MACGERFSFPMGILLRKVDNLVNQGMAFGGQAENAY
jgi:hypothetical protein